MSNTNLDSSVVDPATIQAAHEATLAAQLAGTAIALKPKSELEAEAKAAAEAEAEAASDSLADATRKLAMGAENAAFAGLVAQSETVGDALGGAIAAQRGKVWLKQLAAECAACVYVIDGQEKGDIAEATAKLTKLRGLYSIARQTAKARVERYASCPALCLKKQSIVKSQLRSIRQMFDTVLESLGYKLEPETGKFETCDIPKDKTAEQRVKESVIKLAPQSMRGLIDGLKELGPLAIGQICAELARAELLRRCIVAEAQAVELVKATMGLRRQSNESGDKGARVAYKGARVQCLMARRHMRTLQRELAKVA